MKRNKRQAGNQAGFTIIEIIAVLVIIGIIAVFAAVRFSNTTNYDLASQVEVVKAHLRLAQSLAMNAGTDSTRGINFSSSTTYYLFAGANPNTPIMLLGEDNATINLATKESGLIITSAPQVITFDDDGSPGATTITVTTNGGNITITKNTGFIP